MSKSSTPSPRHDSPLDFAKRTVKPNPIVRSSEQRMEQRRSLFFKKVAKGREDKRWEGRSEQILRSDYLSDRRKWEADCRRSAPEFYSTSFEVDENDLPMPSQESQHYMSSSTAQDVPMSSNPEDEVEAIAHMEEEELDALVALADDDYVPQHPPSERYGSDEEDYDSLFMNYLSSGDAQQRDHGQQIGDVEQVDEMEIG